MSEPLQVLMLRRNMSRTNTVGEILINAEELITRLFVKSFGPERLQLTESVCDERLIDESDEVLS